MWSRRACKRRTSKPQPNTSPRACGLGTKAMEEIHDGTRSAWCPLFRALETASCRHRRGQEAMEAAKNAADSSAAAASHASFLVVVGLLIRSARRLARGVLASPRVTASVAVFSAHQRAERRSSMDTNKIEGAARDAVGRLKDGTGGVTGDLGLQVAGKIDQVGGRLQKEYGSFAQRDPFTPGRPHDAGTLDRS